MTSRAADEPRLKPLRDLSPFGGSWLNARTMLWAAGGSIAVLFCALWLALRTKPLPRRRADFPAPPQLNSQISSAQDRLKANPQDISALVELGTLLFERGKDSYVDAINDLEEARDLGALDPRIFYCLGIMYQEEGLYPFALTEYQRFLRHYPEDKEVRLLSAKLYYRMGLFPEAVGEYERLKFMSPSDPLVEENLGLSLWGAKLMDRALGSFGQLKTYGGDFGRRAEFYKGQIALDAAKYQEAADDFALCGISAGPLPGIPDERVYTGLGMALQKLSRWDEAKTAWEAVLKAAPKDPKAQAALREVNRRLAAAKRTKKK
ncbi:MAG: tetratricopeptide repeat protein [Elusimicrobiota bacterium]